MRSNEELLERVRRRYRLVRETETSFFMLWRFVVPGEPAEVQPLRAAFSEEAGRATLVLWAPAVEAAVLSAEEARRVGDELGIGELRLEAGAHGVSWRGAVADLDEESLAYALEEVAFAAACVRRAGAARASTCALFASYAEVAR